MKIDPDYYTLGPDDIVEVSDIDLDEEVVIMDGRRFTESDAEALADIAEAKVLERRQAQQRGLHRGGYSLSGDGSHSPRFSITLPREVSEKVRAQAAAESISVSKWLRQVVEDRVASTN